jgi:YVTN family beta-propeller protein
VSLRRRTDQGVGDQARRVVARAADGLLRKSLPRFAAVIRVVPCRSPPPVTATIPVDFEAGGVAVSPDGTRPYVVSTGGDNAHPGGNSVSVIDTATNTVTATIPVGNAPVGVAVGPHGRHVYVTNSGSSSVSVIDTATNSVATTVPVGHFPSFMAVSPDGTHLYVSNSGDSTVSVITISS